MKLFRQSSVTFNARSENCTGGSSSQGNSDDGSGVRWAVKTLPGFPFGRTSSAETKSKRSNVKSVKSSCVNDSPRRCV